MEYTLALIIGIISSLIATATFIGLSELMRRFVLPWYADKIYRGIRIDGKWMACRFGDQKIPDSASRFELDLKQSGDRITGFSTVQGKNEPEPTICKIYGQIRDGNFSATAQPIAPDMLDAMACLFRVIHKDSKLHLKGHLLYLGDDSTQVVTTENNIEFCKVSSTTRP